MPLLAAHPMNARSNTHNDNKANPAKQFRDLVWNPIIGKNNNATLEQINFNALLFSASLLSSLSCIFNAIFLEQSNLPLVVFTVLSSVILTLLYFLSRFKNYHNIWITAVTVLVVLSILWFMNGGALGSISYIYLLGLAMFITIAKRSQQNLIFILFLSNIAIIDILEYYLGDQLVHPYADSYDRYLDVTFVFTLVLFFFFFYLRFIKRALDNKRFKTIRQKKIIGKQNQELLSSIRYASYLQKQIISDENHLGKLFKDYFVLFKPKDIVSGDFYWIKEKGKYSIVVAADCTGHGVPAAFLSVLGITLLEETIEVGAEELNAGELLEKLRRRFIFLLDKNSQGGEYPKDGIDLSICVINYEEYSFQFSGANRQMVMVRNNRHPEPAGYFEKSSLKSSSAFSFKGTKNTIGFNYNKSNFINHKIDFHLGDTFYIFSDGYGDQFDAQNKKKFMVHRMKNEFLKINDLAMNEQKKHLLELHENWKGETNQTDDILIIGLKM